MKTVTINEKDFKRLLQLAWAAINEGLTTEEGAARDTAFLTRLDETPTEENP